MMGSVGGPGGRCFGRLPESRSRMTIATPTTMGRTLRIKAMVNKANTKPKTRKTNWMVHR